MTNNDGAGDVVAAEFIEGMGQLFEADGFGRISGRILGCLMLSAEPRSLQELAETLQVSRASVSTNTRLLEQLGALERVTLPGDRRDYYRIAEDVHGRMLEIRLSRFEHTLRLLAKAQATGAAKDGRVRERIDQFRSFFGDMEEAIRESRTRWERERGARQGARRKTG